MSEPIKCKECGNFFNKEFGICPFCGTALSEDNIELSNDNDALQSSNDTDESYIIKYENRQDQAKSNESPKNTSFFSRHKKGITIAVIVAIVLLLILIIYTNSGYICSQCGKRFHEGKSVFGKYWCNDCFWGK